MVKQPRDLGQVQADDLRVKKQHGLVWMALAMSVKTRLWLGDNVSASRDMALIQWLLARVRRGAARRPLLGCTDGLSAYIDRLALLAHRCRALARHTLTLHEGMYLVGTVYNFCTPHESLHHTQQTTPAMAAGISDHCWTMHELLLVGIGRAKSEVCSSSGQFAGGI
jgi:hypothetical protein